MEEKKRELWTRELLSLTKLLKLNCKSEPHLLESTIKREMKLIS